MPGSIGARPSLAFNYPEIWSDIIFKFMTFQRGIDWGIDLVYPKRCAGCDTPLPPGQPIELCDTCTSSLPWLNPPFCQRCGDDFRVPSEADAEQFANRTCVRCRESPPAYSVARSALKYEGAARAAIHALKFHGRKALGRSLALILEQGFRKFPEIAENAQGILPVPLHPQRQRERGFNQAAVLAKALSPRLGLQYLNGAVARLRVTPPQVGLDRQARIHNMQGAFEVMNEGAIFDKTLLLVDDVMTTGATVSACAQALTKSGAREVRIITFARG